MKVWQARTGQDVDAAFEAFSSSTAEDAQFLRHDVMGSIAHVRGLARAGLIEAAEADALATALKQLLSEAAAGTFRLDPSLEDVHMNIEAALTARWGELGRKLHTGRSRNDQVATCIVLYAREHLQAVAAAALDVAKALGDQAQRHAATPWVARTHGQAAQPATLGFLLAGHAFRFQDAAQQALWAWDHVGESPLGGGAVAGSTLPLDPAYTAGLLGLRPPRNALLATGSRDAVIVALQATTRVGVVCSSLAEDLFQLTARGAMRPPDALTTGSSLMPQKRNPDAIELVRGTGRAISSHEAAVQAICASVGLGYVRDMQLVKPHLVAACNEATGILGILAACVAGSTFDQRVLGADLALPGISATDAAEALVASGVPFRTAYSILAAAHQEGTDPAAAIQAADLPEAAKGACIAALTPDAARRDTLGGPAPVAVQHALHALSQGGAAIAAQAAAAAARNHHAAALLGPEVTT